MPAIDGPSTRATGIDSTAPSTNPATYWRPSRRDRATVGDTPSSAARGAKYGSGWPAAYRASAQAAIAARAHLAALRSLPVPDRPGRRSLERRWQPRPPRLRAAPPRTLDHHTALHPPQLPANPQII